MIDFKTDFKDIRKRFFSNTLTDEDLKQVEVINRYFCIFREENIHLQSFKLIVEY